MAARILDSMKQDLAELVLVPSDGGRFEIEANDTLIYSKLHTGSFPDEDHILGQLGEL